MGAPGFTVRLKAHSLSIALDALDAVEGTKQGLFTRVSATTGELVEAWVYHWAGATDHFAPIDCWGMRSDSRDRARPAWAVEDLSAHYRSPHIEQTS